MYGYLAERKMNIINEMKGGIGYSIHSINPETNYKIMGNRKIPKWKYIIPLSGNKVRVSIVVNRYNINEIYDLIEYIASFKNVRYIQMRRISTDNRFDFLKEDIDIYEKLFKEFSSNNNKIGEFYLADQYMYLGKEINFWRTVETSINSMNYFTDGVISDEYFIVEGYLKNAQKTIKETC